jgi:hypothetical protein
MLGRLINGGNYEVDCQRAFNNDPDICIQLISVLLQEFFRISHLTLQHSSYDFDKKGAVFYVILGLRVIEYDVSTECNKLGYE